MATHGRADIREMPERELIVVTEPGLGIRATRAGVESLEGADVSQLESVLASEDATMLPLFSGAEDEVVFGAHGVEPPETGMLTLSSFFEVTGVSDERLDALAEQLRELDVVDAAYVKPPTFNPVRLFEETVPAVEEPPPATPDFRHLQGYLNPAPGGIDARFAWTYAGGTGGGGPGGVVSIIDIEGNWNFAHEDLWLRSEHLIGGTLIEGVDWRNHGTAVVGEINGNADNNFGIAGICTDARMRVISHGGIGSARAITLAANSLGPGDIMLLEMHRPGPLFNFQPRADQRGYIAVEWWPDDLSAISYATNRGVLVVEAAGNGAENLDATLYDARPYFFPTSWRNPFRRNPVDSRAIVVGAGAPPSGNFGPDRSRLDFSNWGALIDAQGWGREVTTTGYGNLQGGSSENLWYTNTFAGTSSASPIVVGALGCIQGIRRELRRPQLTPAQARTLLRALGSPQQDAPGRPATQRIGNRPNLRDKVRVATGPACCDPEEIMITTFGRPITLKVGLKDCWFQNLVPGTIKIFNPDGTRGEFATNTDFTFTFVRRYDKETGEWRYPYASLSAEGYGRVPPPFNWGT